MARDEIRVVLVKPGDVLLIGNLDPERIYSSSAQVALVDAFETLRQRLGLDVLAFAGDIDIDLWNRSPSEAPVAPPLPSPAATCAWQEPHARESDERSPDGCGWRTLHRFQPVATS